MTLGQGKILNRSNIKLNYVQNILTRQERIVTRLKIFLTRVEKKEENFGKLPASQKNEPEFLILGWLTLT